jgi:hypothetical protein
LTIVPGAAPSEEIGLDLTLPHRLRTVSPIRVTISLSIAAGVDHEVAADRAEAPTAIHTDLRAIFISLELSRATWLITSLSPGGEKMSKHSVPASDIAGLLRRFAQLGRPVPPV